MKYGSVCSGVEAATVAWHPLGWEPQWFSEIEPFPSAVLAHHYPDVPNLGDMTKFKEWNSEPIDLLVGGTPCQSFSVAGLRKGLDDPRGNLMLTYLAMVEHYKPKWVVWENVVGVLSSNRGRDFGTLLTASGNLGYGFAYRVLDAQYFGVPQRRRRVFVVGCLGDWQSAGEVLFERESMRGHIKESKKAGEEITTTVTTRVGGGNGGGIGTDEACGGFLQPVTARMRGFGDYVEDNTASALKARDHKDATDLIAFPAEMSGTQSASTKNLSPTLSAKHTTAVTVIDRAAYNQGENALYEPRIEETDTMPTLVAKGPHAVFNKMRVRRLTPRECERLQGYPDDYTRIPWRKKEAENCPDGHRFKAMGNSMAVPVMRWIGKRIQRVEIYQEWMNENG